MITNRFLSIIGAAAVATAFSIPAYAAEGAAAGGMSREVSARLKMCTLCHGENGNTKSPNIPVIAGQREDYILKQIHDFNAGARKVEVMKWAADSLTPEERPVAAAFFAKANWPAKARPAAATAAPRGVAVCQSCHAQNFMGAAQAEGASTPRLAGQNYEYLLGEMNRFASGERGNNDNMVQIMKGVSPADREAMARYLSGL